MKVAPEYVGSTVHVLDASRAVGVVASLLDPAKQAELDVKNRDEQARLRQLHAGKRVRPLVPFDVACANAPRLSFGPKEVAVPEFLGVRVLDDVPLGEIAKFIDWTFFFTAWEMTGKFPDLLQHPERGPAARDLYAAGRSSSIASSPKGSSPHAPCTASSRRSRRAATSCLGPTVGSSSSPC